MTFKTSKAPGAVGAFGMGPLLYPSAKEGAFVTPKAPGAVGGPFLLDPPLCQAMPASVSCHQVLLLERVAHTTVDTKQTKHENSSKSLGAA